ncbi:MAG: hypothetical protein ABIH23_35670 [bacterium]
MEGTAPEDVFVLIALIVGVYIILRKTPKPAPAEPYQSSAERYDRSSAFAGVNSLSSAQRWLLEDLKRARHNVFIVTGTGRDAFWAEPSIVHALLRAKERGVKTTFLVGPAFHQALKEEDTMRSNIMIRTLGAQATIEIRLLDQKPFAGLRLVDNEGTYTTTSGNVYRDPGIDCREYLWTWGDPEIARTQRELIDKYLVSSRAVTADELTLTR